MAALRLGLRGRGGGGTEWGVSRVRSERCVALRRASSVAMGALLREGQDMALLVGSRWRGRRVNVSSMAAGGGGGGAWDQRVM